MSMKIKDLVIELTKVLSVVETPGEVNISSKIYEILSRIDYYKENPEDLKYLMLENDPLERRDVMAILRGKGDSKETIVLIGHMDTVGISDYGQLKEYANNPKRLAEELYKRRESLDLDTRKDLESGEYLFGRGIFDMKMGDAIIISILERISKELEDLNGNLIFGAVCDEEANSRGMLRFIEELIKIEEEENFEYIALIDTDYMTEEYKGDLNKYIYVGAVGKLMPSFYVVGKETHVGEAFNGIDPNEIVASLVDEINMNTDYCDEAEGEYTLPPLSLSMKDLKTEYSVQTAKTSHVFFNYATHKKTPDKVLNLMKQGANKAFTKVVDKLNREYKTYCDLSRRPYSKLDWQPRVLTYSELYDLVYDELGEDLNIWIREYEDELLGNKDIDERIYSLKMVEFLHGLWSDQKPVIIVYLTPPYYPHIYVSGEDQRERRVLDAVEKTVDELKTPYTIKYRKFFPYIADLSYGAAPKDDLVLDALKENMPGYGNKYKLPLEEMQKLDLPVLNIGSFGKDAHKFTERVHIGYSTEVAPELLYRTIYNLLG